MRRPVNRWLGAGSRAGWRHGLKLKVRRNKKETFKAGQVCKGEGQWVRTRRFVSKVLLCLKYAFTWFDSEWHHTLKICIESKGGPSILTKDRTCTGCCICSLSRDLESYEAVLTRYKHKGGTETQRDCQSHTADKPVSSTQSSMTIYWAMNKWVYGKMIKQASRQAHPAPKFMLFLLYWWF